MGNKASNDKAAHQMREGFKEVGKGLQQGVRFVGDQLQHPDARRFMRNAAEIATTTEDPMEMQMKLGQLGSEQVNRSINKTIDHYTGHKTTGDGSMGLALNALTFV